MSATDAVKDVEAKARKFRRMVPHVLNISRRVLVSHGLFLGANDALCQSDDPPGSRRLDVIGSYREDAGAMTVVGVCSLLDRNGADTVSFHKVFKCLQDRRVSAVVERHWQEDEHRLGHLSATCKEAIDQFLELYCGLDRSDAGPIGRIRKLRNKGIAHLLDERAALLLKRERATYDDVHATVVEVGRMAQALHPFDYSDATEAGPHVFEDMRAKAQSVWIGEPADRAPLAE